MEYIHTRGVLLAIRYMERAAESLSVAGRTQNPDQRLGELSVSRSYLKLAQEEIDWIAANLICSLPIVTKTATLLSVA